MSPFHKKLQRTVHRDRTTGLVASFFIHAAVFFLGGAMFVHSAEFGVQTGGGVEIDLVAAPMAAIAVPVPQEIMTAPDEDKDSIEEPAPIAPPAAVEPPKLSGDGSSAVPGKDSTTFRSYAGATVEAKPKYLRNPAPAYPAQSRRNGEEGLVFLTADVDASGRAIEVRLKKSSGYPLLDDSALNTVKRWKFEPAKLGTLKVDSRVEIPVRFQLKEN